MNQADSEHKPADAQVEQARMSFGDHLDELRRRLIYALLGLIVTVGVCIFFAENVITFLCQPLVLALKMAGQSGQLYTEQVPQLFMNYMEMAIMAGALLASPWILIQVWKFIGAGLYAHEQKFVKKYGAFSLGLFLIGAAFVYFIALPFALKYFAEFPQIFKSPDPSFRTPVQRLMYGGGDAPPATHTTTQPQAVRLPVLAKPPADKSDGVTWIDPASRHLRYYYDGKAYAVAPLPDAMVAPLFNLADYLSFVTSLMLVFGLGFQTPLIILFLDRIDIMPAASMAKKRRVLILVIVVIAAMITPTGDLLSLLLLAIPMWGLFELGLVLAKRARRRADAAKPA